MDEPSATPRANKNAMTVFFAICLASSIFGAVRPAAAQPAETGAPSQPQADPSGQPVEVLPQTKIETIGEVRPAEPNAHKETVHPATAKELALFEQAAERFRWAGLQLQAELQTVIKRKVHERQQSIEDEFSRQIELLGEAEKQDREQAIQYHENFLKRYPAHPEHTPDAMFRLAELHFEQSQVAYYDAEKRFEEMRALYNRGKIPALPESPTQDYEKSVKLYQDLLKRFPTYRFADATYYLLAYCQINSGKDLEARDSLAALVEKFPESKYAPEAWLRIGEIHFDFGEFEKAAACYAQAMKYKDSKFYQLAMYKLAWSYFQAYRYNEAIQQFKQLISEYDKAGRDEESTERSTQLRKEAIDYLARSLAEDDWDGDGVNDAQAGVDRAFSYLSAGDRTEEDILAAYAGTLFDLHERPKYLESISVYRRLLQRNPLNSQNPDIQARIIEICDILREGDCGATARLEMATMFAPESAWYKANRENIRATTAADKAVELSLRQAAQFHHQRAQELKTQARTLQDTAMLSEARREYEAAAKGYQQYLERYPQSPFLGEVSLFYAEALYWTDHFLQAAEQYERVRDMSQLKLENRDVAAFSAIKAVEKHIESLVDQGQLPRDPFRREAENSPPENNAAAASADQEVKPQQPEEIPPILLRWAKNAEAYIKGGFGGSKDPSMIPNLQYQIADLFYRYDHFDEARSRFEQIIAKYPGELVASYAAANIVNSYREENDWANIEKWAQIISEKQIGDPKGRQQLVEQVRMRKVGAEFQQATNLLQRKEYASAAETYVRLVDQNPDFSDADRALYNAALAYQEIKRYDSAARLFERIVTEDRFKSSDLHEDALFRLSENYRKFFNFDRATNGYLALARRYEKSERAPFCLLQAAELLEYQGDTSRANELFGEHLRRFGDHPEAPDIRWRRVEIARKMSNKQAEQAELNAFLSAFGQGFPKQSARVVESYVRLADMAKERQNLKEARTFYERAITEFTGRELKDETPEASFAAKAQFELVEMEFRDYQAIQIRGTLDQMGKAIRRKQEMLTKLEKRYIDIFPYKSFDWTIAGYYRIGYLYQEFARSLYSAPPPSHLRGEEIDLYQTQVEDEATKWEDVAVKRYEETLQQARRLRILNEWVKLTLEQLNKYKPQEYPLFKEEKVIPSFELFSEPSAYGHANVQASTDAEALPNGESGAVNLEPIEAPAAPEPSVPLAPQAPVPANAQP